MNILDQVLNYDSNKNILLYNAMNHCDSLLTQNNHSFLTTIKISSFIIYQSFLSATYKIFEGWTRLLFRKQEKKQLLQQINSDLTFLGENKKKIERMTRQLIAKASLFNGYSEEQKDLAVKIAMATYATTKQFYSPIIEKWSKSLLARAQQQNLQLVFLARDGNAPFELTKKLKKANPSFKNVKVTRLYLSRKIVSNTDRKKLSKYINQELGPTGEQKQLFIDIGFFGSMIQKIRETAGPSTPFEFLVSTSSRAHGFAGNLKSVLPSIKSAGKNRGVYWIEATHQGVIDSPSELVLDAKNRLAPNTVVNNITCQKRNELDFLCKQLASKALLQSARIHLKVTKEDARDLIDTDSKKQFDSFIDSVKTKRFLYVNNE